MLNELRNFRKIASQHYATFKITSQFAICEALIRTLILPMHLTKLNLKNGLIATKKTFCCIILVQRKLTNPASEHLNLNRIDLTDYLFLPDSLVSMLTNFRITSADGNDIPMFLQS